MKKLERISSFGFVLVYMASLFCSIGYSILYEEPTIAIGPVLWCACSFDRFLEYVEEAFFED